MRCSLIVARNKVRKALTSSSRSVAFHYSFPSALSLLPRDLALRCALRHAIQVSSGRHSSWVQPMPPVSSLLTDAGPTVPRDLTTWQWLFEDSTYSPIHRFPEEELGGYHDASTKEQLNWREVKETATHLSTALVKKHGLKEGETVALFSQNTIWYPVAMHATLRVGGRVSGASPAYNTEEMTYALQKADAKFIFTHPSASSQMRYPGHALIQWLQTVWKWQRQPRKLPAFQRRTCSCSRERCKATRPFAS